MREILQLVPRTGGGRGLGRGMGGARGMVRGMGGGRGMPGISICIN